MSTTRRVAREEWERYFANCTARFTERGAPVLVTAELLSESVGDQIEARDARLQGFIFDPLDDRFEVAFDDREPLRFLPSEIWVIEDDRDLLTAVELVMDDGSKEIISISAGRTATQAAGASAPPA